MGTNEMNRPVAVAAIIMGLTFGLHLIGGETTVHRPLLADGKTAAMDLYISVLWHGISSLIGLNTVALAFAAWKPGPHGPILWLVGGQTLAVGLLFILYGLIRTGSLWTAPQWIILVPLGLLTIWAAMRAPGPRTSAA
jgi:hypothetical protein